MGFYQQLNEDNVIIASLIKTSKKDILTEEKRQVQVEYLSEGERVYLEEDFNCDGLLVKSDTGYELGELSQSISKEILERNKYLEYIFVKVAELDYIDKVKVKLKIYL